MAKRRSQAKSTGRSTKATSRRPAKAQASAPAAMEVEIVEEQGGEGIETGILVITSVMLVAAIFFVDALLGKFGSGVFFG